MALFNFARNFKNDQPAPRRDVRLTSADFAMLDRHFAGVARQVANTASGRFLQQNYIEFGGVPADIAAEADRRLAELRQRAESLPVQLVTLPAGQR